MFSDCTYLGKIYKSGESFQKGDKCNTCICSITGDVRCTEMSCIDTYVKPTPEITYEKTYVPVKPISAYIS